MEPLHLHIGCGDRLLDGFLNIDFDGKPDLQLDVTRGLPFESGTVDAIFNEHFIEHITRDQGIRFLRECHRVLKPGGVVRIATPDLGTVVRGYLADDWRRMEWVDRFGFGWLSNGCEMLNVSMREWKHLHVYDDRDLKAAGRHAGFFIARSCEDGRSAIAALSGLEHRRDSLIVEFEKEDPAKPDPLPLVSVLIPAYNQTFLVEAVESALAQDYPCLQVLVCNDQPSGPIRELLAPYLRDGRLEYFEHPANVGALGNYLKCFELARGDYIKFLNDDDTLRPDCVSRMVRCFEAYGDRVTLVTSRRRRIDESGRELKDKAETLPMFSRDTLVCGRDLGSLLLRHGVNLVGEPSTAMFRRSDLGGEPGGLFSFRGRPYRQNVDVALWLRLLAKGDAVYLADALSALRIHPAQDQANPANLFELTATWHDLRLDGLAGGFLGTESSRRLAFTNHLRLLKARLPSSAFSPEQRARVQALIEDTEGLLRGSASPAGAGGEEIPTLKDELAAARNAGWLGELRNRPLPGGGAAPRPRVWSGLRRLFGKRRN